MIFLFIAVVVLAFFYTIISWVQFSSLSNKHLLSKEIQRKILDKIEGGISVDYIDDGGGVIYTFPDRLIFERGPFFIRYEFKGIGWTTPWSPLSKKLGEMEKYWKRKSREKGLKRYGLGDGLC